LNIEPSATAADPDVVIESSELPDDLRA